MAFKYVAYDNSGNVVQGSMNGTSEELAKDTLRQWGYQVLSLRSTRDRMSWRRQLPSLFKVSTQDLIMFSRLMATLVERGTNTLVALQLVKDEAANPVFREVLDSIAEDVRRGKALSEAMSQYPKVFSSMYCRMVRVSEQAGNLEVVLYQMADYLGKESALMSRVTRALAYPAVVMVIAAAVTVLLVTFVIPSFADLFTEFGSEIPLPTRIIIAISSFASQNKFILVISLVIISTLIVVLLQHPKTRSRLDSLMLNLPILGSIILLSEMARFSRVVAMGLREGLKLPEILEMAAGISRNRLVTSGLEQVRNEILEGRRLSHALSDNPVFPKMLVQLARVGEETANLENGLEAVADAYETQVERRINTIVAMLEPGVMLFIGLIVAFIAISVILPTYAILGEI